MSSDYKSIAVKLKFEGRAFIDGKYVDAIDGEKFENINPATGETLCSVAKCNHKDVDLAVKFQEKLLIVVFGQEHLQNLEKTYYLSLQNY